MVWTTEHETKVTTGNIAKKNKVKLRSFEGDSVCLLTFNFC